MTDEKLAECSASATGVYIRIMCLMHKSEGYGKILLRQKYKQNTKQISNFAMQVAKNMPYDLQTIEDGLLELLTEGVLIIEGDCIYQKRMVEDNYISITRASSGARGGIAKAKIEKEFARELAKAKNIANTEYENESVNESVNVLKGMNTEYSSEVFKFDLKTGLPPMDLESAERNQFSLYQKKNTEFIKSQWKVFLSERMNDPPEKKIQYKRMHDLTSYFLNWIRPKSPKNGTAYKPNDRSAKPVAEIVTETGTRGF
jgi:hypothetical protein